MYGLPIPSNCQLANKSISRKGRNAISSQKRSIFVEELYSNQEEATTKIALRIKYATMKKNPGPVVVRSYSGDTITLLLIPVLFIALFANTDHTMYFDNGSGNHRIY